MGNEASLIKKCTVAPKPRHSTTEWSLYDASYASQQYSLFIFSDDRYFNDITVCGLLLQMLILKFG